MQLCDSDQADMFEVLHGAASDPHPEMRWSATYSLKRRTSAIVGTDGTPGIFSFWGEKVTLLIGHIASIRVHVGPRESRIRQLRGGNDAHWLNEWLNGSHDNPRPSAGKGPLTWAFVGAAYRNRTDDLLIPNG